MRRVMMTMMLFGAVLGAVPSSGQDKKKPEKKVAPKVLLVHPLGAPPGISAKLTVRGVNLDQAKEVKLKDGAVKILGKGKSPPPDKLPPEKYGDSHLEIEVKLADKLGNGSATFTVVTPEGETPGHAILVETRLPVIKDKEPNDGFRQGQPLNVPCLVEGAIERPRDVDVFRIDGKAGQKLVVELAAARHGSALDAMLTLYSSAGNQVASGAGNADNPDARLMATLPADGTYFLSLLDLHDTGGALHVYRLTIR